MTGTLLTLLLFFGARKALLDPFHAKIEADISVRTRLLQESLEKSLLAAKAMQQQVQLGNVVEERNFHEAASSFLEEEVGLDSILWIPLVARKDRSHFEEMQTKITGRDFRIFDFDSAGRPVAAGERDFFCPIVFIANHAVTPILSFGFDTAADPRQLVALERARESAKPSVTELVTLPTRNNVAGIVAYIPVYAQQMPLGTSDERRAATRGFIAAVFYPDCLIKTVLKPTKPLGIPFDLYDVSNPADRRLVYHWTARLQPASSLSRFLYSPPPTFTQKFIFADREWELSASPNIAYLKQNHPLGHWLLLLSGSLLTMFIAVFFQKGLAQREHLSDLNKTLESEIEERIRAEASLKKLLQELQVALTNVKTLEGILPICASCKNIRDDKGYWIQVESYVSKHTTAEFSHGICPDCAKKLYPEFLGEIP